MTRRQFSGDEVASVLIDNGYYPVDRGATWNSATSTPRPARFGTSPFRFTTRSHRGRSARSRTSAARSTSTPSASGSTGIA